MTANEERINRVVDMQKVREDIIVLTGLLSKLESGESENFMVLGQGYTNPIHNGKTLPMNHTEGLDSYYRRLLHRLRRINEDGKTIS